VARILIEFGAELGERFQRTILGQVDAQRAGHFFHGLGLGRAADARHGQADVDRRALAGKEQLTLQINLSVCDRDDIRRNVGGDIAALRLDDRQGRNRTAAQTGMAAAAALQQAGVQVENVAREGFTARRAAQQQ